MYDLSSPFLKCSAILSKKEIKHQQKTYKIKGIEKIEKKKINLELKYLKQLLDQNKIEIEIFDELKKTNRKRYFRECSS